MKKRFLSFMVLSSDSTSASVSGIRRMAMVAIAAAVALWIPPSVLHAQSTLKSAKVTLAEGSVTTGPLGKPASTPLTKGSVMTSSDYARSGAASRAEFEFSDGSLFRIGERTIFSFQGGGRTLRVDEGEGVLSIPKRQGQTTITTPALSAAVMGTTIYISARPGKIVYACLEGKCKVGPYMMLPGQILTVAGSKWDYSVPPAKFQIAKFVRSNILFTKFHSRLPGEKLIQDEIKAQDSQSFDDKKSATAAPKPSEPAREKVKTTRKPATL